MTPFAIAGIQLHVSAERDNLEHITAQLNQLMHLFPWVQMVVLPELCVFGPSPAKAQPLPGPAEEALCRLADKHEIWLIPGSLFEKTDDELIFNTSPVIDPTGTVVCRYRKMFPFRPYEEGIEPGEEFCVFDVPDVGRFGLSICYDMWFPETSRTLAALGAEVIIHPSMTATIDRDVELAIVRATAATNQCFVMDMNGVGAGGLGRSIIAGPVGEVIYQAGDAQETIPLEIDLDRVRRSREFGLRGLGQPLKSFRDRKILFPVYGPGAADRGYFKNLGPLSKPTRGSKAGLRAATPGVAETPAPAHGAPS